MATHVVPGKRHRQVNRHDRSFPETVAGDGLAADLIEAARSGDTPNPPDIGSRITAYPGCAIVHCELPWHWLFRGLP